MAERRKASGATVDSANSPRRRSGKTLPKRLEQILPKDTAHAWQALREVLPDRLYLIGGTAVAVHLGHRQSRDLDFFSHERAIDLDALAKELEALPGFLLTHTSAGTLKGLLGETKVELFVELDDKHPQRALEAAEAVAGLYVASLRDLAAMKLKVIGDRGEMRDYFDLKLIEEQGGITIENGLLLFLERYGPDPRGPALGHIVRALGYLDDVEEDDGLPVTKQELAAWWRKRQAALVRSLDRRAKP
jgi:Nucleotidyl transferase AbiEii toxin, Type IV TA system